MPKQPSLLFIPDISGFTNFVHSTEIEHSSHIISELLEALIDSNELGLKLAEIEGDALFFYIDGEVPSKEALFHQIEKMYLAFHNHLLAYQYRRICRCGACTSAADLKLKFVIHAGEMNYIKVKESSKPFGPHVVLAHRLLKNSIDLDEYSLLSGDLNDVLSADPSIEVHINESPKEGEEEYDLGKVIYTYYPLVSLRKYIDAAQSIEAGERVSRPWIKEMNIESPVESLYNLISNFDRRLEWTPGVLELKYEKDRVNRQGSEHICVVNEKLINFKTITSDFGGKWVYGESTEDVPFVDVMYTYFIFEPISDKETKLTIEVHPYVKSAFKRLLIPIMKFFAWKNLSTQFDKIKTVAER